MWKIELHPHQFLRRRSFGTAQVVLCFLAFGLTASVVCHWGAVNWMPADSGPAFDATDNDLAERQLGELRESWKRRAADVCQKARESEENARKEHEKSVARLEAFQSEMRRTAEASAKQPATVERQEKPQQPQLIDNPAWQELDRKLAKLNQRREQLLVNRTPIHPAVREIDDDIEEVQSQLTAIPRQIPDPKAGSRETAEKPIVDITAKKAGELAAKENQRKLNELTAAVEKNRQAMEKASLAVQQAVQESQNEPKFAVEPPQVALSPSQVDYGWQRLIWTTLMASVLMTFGVGSVSLGSSIEPPVTKVEEVQADLNVPIVGVIPSSDPLPSEKAVQHQWRIRRASIAVGLLLIVACPVVAILGVAGM